MNIEEARKVFWLKSNHRSLRGAAVKVYPLREYQSPKRDATQSGLMTSVLNKAFDGEL